jgi:hypothetical protein
MANLSASGDRKLGGFISYSRKDEDFAQELLAGLEAASTGRYDARISLRRSAEIDTGELYRFHVPPLPPRQGALPRGPDALPVDRSDREAAGGEAIDQAEY